MAITLKVTYKLPKGCNILQCTVKTTHLSSPNLASGRLLTDTFVIRFIISAFLTCGDEVCH